MVNKMEYFTTKGLDNYQKLAFNISSEIARSYDTILDFFAQDRPKKSMCIESIKEIRIAEMKLSEIRHRIINAQIIDYDSDSSLVHIGTGVTYGVEGKINTICIVANGEEDKISNRILYKTPLARALLGRKVGEEYMFMLNNQEMHFKILQINIIY